MALAQQARDFYPFRLYSLKCLQFLLDVDSVRPLFHSLFISESGTIILRHKRIIIYVSVHFTFGKNACSVFTFTWMFERLCRSNRSHAFLGASASVGALLIL